MRPATTGAAGTVRRPVPYRQSAPPPGTRLDLLIAYPPSFRVIGDVPDARAVLLTVRERLVGEVDR